MKKKKLVSQQIVSYTEEQIAKTKETLHIAIVLSARSRSLESGNYPKNSPLKKGIRFESEALQAGGLQLTSRGRRNGKFEAGELPVSPWGNAIGNRNKRNLKAVKVYISRLTIPFNAYIYTFLIIVLSNWHYDKKSLVSKIRDLRTIYSKSEGSVIIVGIRTPLVRFLSNEL